MSTATIPEIDSSTHLDLASLEEAWGQAEPAPRDEGLVTLILARQTDGRRHTPTSLRVDMHEGIPGDRWHTGRRPDPDTQIAVQGHRIATLIANGQPLSLFGDNLTIDLDLSEENLPPGTLLEIGEAAFVLAATPHNGCLKYRGRFGVDALRFISARERRSQRLRGIYVRVVQPGEIRVGDPVRVTRPWVGG